MQREHHNTGFEAKQFPITLICDNISNAPNIGSIFRIADAFGLELLIFCGEDIPLGKRMKKTSRATENHVRFTMHKDCHAVVEDYKKRGYTIAALEITTKSQSLHNFQFSQYFPLALIIGSEMHGISSSVLKLADLTFHIDMYGHNSSMNVTHAASIALYEITKQNLSS